MLNERGVSLRLGEEIKSIPLNFDYVIGCDGPFSVIRKELGLKDPEMKIGMQVFVDKKDNANFTDIFPIQSGFLWKIPKGDYLEYGILSKSSKAKDILINFLEKEKIKEKQVFAASVPLGMVFSKDKRVALCGDAMGLTKPWSGGGIIWSLYAASILVETFPDFKEYEKKTRQFFQYKILKGLIANKLVNLIGFTFPYIIPSKINYDNDFPNFFKSMIDLIRKNF